MLPFVFFRPVLRAVNDGQVIRTSIALVLRAFSVLILLAGIYGLIEILKASFRLPTEGTIGGLILAIVFSAAVLAVMQILLCRAEDVLALEASPFTVIPICSVLLRASGEIYSTFGLAIGVGGCVFIWLSGINPVYLLGSLSGLFPVTAAGGTFFSGFLFLLNLILLSFFGLLLAYFLAESVVVLVDIAKNMRTVAKQTAVASR